MSEPSGIPPSNTRAPGTLGAKLVTAGLLLALVCAVLAVLSGLGHRMGLWHFRTGFTILQAAFWGALVAGVVCIAGVLLGRKPRPQIVAMALVGVAIAIVTAYIPWNLKRVAGSVPRIHDITTDFRNPPAFVAAAKLRKPTDNPADYDGVEIGAMQREAYADLQPLLTGAPPDQAFAAAKTALSEMGLEIIDSNQAEGRLEAVDTTLWYGFKDDMVIRILENAGNGSRIDVRSKSRLGKSDLGVNAKRIRTFFTKLRAALPAA